VSFLRGKFKTRGKWFFKQNEVFQSEGFVGFFGVFCVGGICDDIFSMKEIFQEIAPCRKSGKRVDFLFFL